MSEYSGYYSVIQFCPDPARAEVANVGVLLFCPQLGFIRARTSVGNDRIRQVFPGLVIDTDWMNTIKRSVERRLEVDAGSFASRGDLDHFIATRANDINLTPARPVKVTEPNAGLDALFDDLAGERPC